MNLLRKSHIGRLRVLTGSDDAPGDARRVARLVESGAFDAAGGSPSSVLIVRRLRDPLPGSIAVGDRVQRLNPAWERAAADALGDVSRSAARPARGFVPPGSEAVLFADEAELLACLAIDLVRNTAAQRWWWEAVRDSYCGGGSLEELLVRFGWAMPAVFDQLARVGRAREVIDSLSPTACLRLLRRLADEFGLTQLNERVMLADALSAGGPSNGETLAATDSKQTVQMEAAIVGQTGATASPPPWSGYLSVTEVDDALSLAQQLLWAVVLLIRRAPHVVRTRRFAVETAKWVATKRGIATPADGDEQSDSVVNDARNEGQTVNRESSSEPTDEPNDSVDDSSSRKTGRPRGSAAPASVDDALSPEYGTSASDTAQIAESVDTLNVTRESERSVETTTRTLDSVRDSESPSTEYRKRERILARQLASEGIPTKLGGVLYLINVLDRLDVPPDIPVRPWARIETLARALVRDLAIDFDDDAIWCVLAELDRREPDSPPDTSLAESDPGFVCRVAGFACTALESDSIPEALDELLVCPGRVYVSATHVDFVAGLDRISVAVRRAGFDGDPGWRPDYGRVILFHFE